MDDVLITGMGIVSPLGIGRDAVWDALEKRRSGVRAISDFGEAGWLAPYGGQVTDFEPKQYVKPRKSLKVMVRETQFAFAAAELAREDAGLVEGAFDPERAGVLLGAGTMYCDPQELVDSYSACLAEGKLDFDQWGDAGVHNLFPLWMLKYLPNMPACHIGIRQDARGPNNTISHGDVSSLLALAEAMHVIRRGQADIMFAGGTSSRLAISDLLWHHGARLAVSKDSPETLSRPFDVARQGMVVGEGSAMFLLESASHAARRGAKPLAQIATIVSRNEATIKSFRPPGRAIANAFSAALESVKLQPADIDHVNAHGASTVEDDSVEATAIAQVLEGANVPVTAPKSYFGNLGAGSGAVELAVSLLAVHQGQIPMTLNHNQTDPACPVHVVTSPTPTTKPTFTAINHASTGQAVAAVFRVE